MDYRCERCGTVLQGGAMACAACGRQFESPVPKEAGGADSGIDAVLRERTANRPVARQESLPGNTYPSYYGTPPPSHRGSRARLGIGIGLVAVSVLGCVAWGSSVLWMRGAGGDLAYQQHNLAGNAASERGDFRQADDEYGQMIALRPKRVDGYLLRGINEEQEGQYAAAIDDNTTALTLTQEPMMRGDLLSNRADGYVHQGRLTRAIADDTQANYEYAQVRNPRLLSYVPERVADDDRHRADALWQHKEYARAITDCSTVIASSPHRPDDFGLRAKAEAMLGQDKAAQSDFLQALRLDPTDDDGYIGLGNIAEKRHQFAQAVLVYQRAVQADPHLVQLRGNLGWCQYEAGQYRQAIATDRQAQALNPNQEWINYNLALCYAVTGDSVQAKAGYADAAAHGTQDDQKSGMADIRTALARQPGSALLRSVFQQVAQSSPDAIRSPRPVPVPLVSPAPRPAPLFAALLSPEVRLGDYALHPPVGYTLTQHPLVALSSTGAVYLWSGPQRPDGTVPTLQVEINVDDGALAAHSTSAQETRLAQLSKQANHSQLVFSPVTPCQFGGVSFARGDWKGIGQKTGKTYWGSEYYSISAYRSVSLSVHDAFPYARTTQPLLLASLQTFRKL